MSRPSTSKPAAGSDVRDEPESVAPEISEIDVGAISAQLLNVTGALDQLQNDNRILSDALSDTQGRLKESRVVEREAGERVDAADRDVARAKAAVARRENEIADLEAEISKLRSERVDWEAMILAERDAVLEQQTADLAAARVDLKAFHGRIADLEDELALERQRTAPDTHLVQLMTTAGTTLLVDGEGMVAAAWPDATPERRRSQVIEAATRFHRRHRVSMELLFESVDGWNPEADLPVGVRIRVPHEGIPIPACLTQLAKVHGNEAPLVTVSGRAAREPWISLSRASELMGLPVPPTPQHNNQNQDLEPMEAEK